VESDVGGDVRADESDEQMMAAVLHGDRAALAVLVERHHGPVLSYLYRLTGGHHPLAEDLAQETFLALLTDRRAATYAMGRPFKPWLYAIATNLARDHFKSAAARRTADAPEAELLALYDDAPSPEERAIAADEGSRVAAALGQLGEEYRVALLLRFYQGLSLQEIAEALGIPLGTVKSRLSVGTRRLRTLLASAETSAETNSGTSTGEGAYR
jgi:RNA polymerase sigma-70 factor (ECF subfamily)